MLKGRVATCLAAALLFVPLPILYLLRDLDDNSLTSWRHAWEYGDFPLALSALVIALVVARVLSHLPAPRRRLLFVAAAAAGVGALFASAPEAIVDTARYFTQAKYLARHGTAAFLQEWGRGVDAWTDLPLAPFLYGWAFRLLGESRWAAQAVSLSLFAAAAAATAALGRRLWDDETGLFAGILLLGIPYLHTQAPLMLTDVPTMCFMVLAVLAFHLAVEEGGAGRVAAAGVCVGLALLVKYSTWVFLPPVIAAVALAARPRNGSRRAALLRGGAALLLGGVIAGVFVLGHPSVVAAQIDLLRGYQRAGLSRWGESWLSTFLFQTHPLITLLAVFAAARGAARRDLAVAVPLAPLALLLLMGVERIRYTLPLFPFLALLAARGLAGLAGERELRRFVAFGIAAGALVVSLAGFRPLLGHGNLAALKLAGEELDRRGVRVAEVVTLPIRGTTINPEIAVPLLDLHTHAALRHRRLPLEPPPGLDVSTSTFRFTWERTSPAWYGPPRGEPRPGTVVLVAGPGERRLPGEVEALLEGYRPAGRFEVPGHSRWRPAPVIYERRRE